MMAITGYVKYREINPKMRASVSGFNGFSGFRFSANGFSAIGFSATGFKPEKFSQKLDANKLGQYCQPVRFPARFDAIAIAYLAKLKMASMALWRYMSLCRYVVNGRQWRYGVSVNGAMASKNFPKT